MATSLNAPLHVELQSQVGGNMAFVPAAIAAGATLGAGALNYLGARQANQMNMKIAKKQMHFQERMSNTAYQRTVEDMRAAGLNPALAYNLGGASSPMGSSTNVGNELSGAVNSALDAQRAFAEVKNLEETNKNLQSQNKLIAAQRRQADSQSEFNTTSAARLSASFPFDMALVQANTAKSLSERERVDSEKVRQWVETISDNVNPLKYLMKRGK